MNQTELVIGNGQLPSSTKYGSSFHSGNPGTGSLNTRTNGLVNSMIQSNFTPKTNSGGGVHGHSVIGNSSAATNAIIG